jgi:hypothetical protein
MWYNSFQHESLALLESRIVLEELLKRLSCVTLASPQENIEYVPSLAFVDHAGSIAVSGPGPLTLMTRTACGVIGNNQTASDRALSNTRGAWAHA